MGNQDFLQNPRPVSRGLNFQIGFLGIDSLYLVIEYPHVDIFNRWSSIVPDTQDKRLFAGIPFDDFVIRKGAHGYKLSLWDGDTRLYITDQVDEKLEQEGSSQVGMGALLQLGTNAHEQNNPRRRSRLNGSNTDKPRYRHAQGTQCGCKSRSVVAEQLETDFFRLVNLLTVKPDIFPEMLALATQNEHQEVSEEDLEMQKRTAIAREQRRIEAARSLYCMKMVIGHASNILSVNKNVSA